MREIRQSGSEGGAASSRSYPYRPKYSGLMYWISNSGHQVCSIEVILFCPFVSCLEIRAAMVFYPARSFL